MDGRTDQMDGLMHGWMKNTAHLHVGALPFPSLGADTTLKPVILSDLLHSHSELLY